MVNPALSTVQCVSFLSGNCVELKTAVGLLRRDRTVLTWRSATRTTSAYRSGITNLSWYIAYVTSRFTSRRPRNAPWEISTSRTGANTCSASPSQLSIMYHLDETSEVLPANCNKMFVLRRRISNRDNNGYNKFCDRVGYYKFWTAKFSLHY